MDRKNNSLKRKQPDGAGSSNAQGNGVASSSVTNNPSASSPNALVVLTSCNSCATQLTLYDEFLAEYGNWNSGEDVEAESDSGLPNINVNALQEEADDDYLLFLENEYLSYEEPVYIEEQTGLSRFTICEHLRRRIYFEPDTSGPQTQEAICSICLEGFHEGELIGTLDCDHEYHYDCVKEWLLRKNTCPSCRSTGIWIL